MESEGGFSQSAFGEARVSRRDKLIGRFFGRERKGSSVEDESGPSTTPGDLNDFFRGAGNSADILSVSHAPPPPPPPQALLSRLDTASATRYPQAASVAATAASRSQQSLSSTTYRPRTPPPRRRKAGLAVVFSDAYPEVIGEGGDECEVPVMEIGKRKRAISAPARVPPPPSAPPYPQEHARERLAPPPRGYSDSEALDDGGGGGMANFIPPQPHRSPTGLSSARMDGHDSSHVGWKPPVTRKLLPAQQKEKDDNRRSFIEVHQAEMRVAEGMALAQAAARTASRASNQEWEERKQSPADAAPPDASSPASASEGAASSPDRRILNRGVDQSPASIHSTASASLLLAKLQSGQSARQNHPKPAADKEPDSPSRPPPVQKRPTNLSFHDVVVASGDDALDVFVSRTKHLFELFRLHAETLKPLSASSVEDLSRAALWWFLSGRLTIELVSRDRPTSPQEQRHHDVTRQQAYADLAKGYWLCEEAVPEVMEDHRSPAFPESDEIRKTLVSNLRKLAISMKRNGLLPPDELFLPQTIDKAIWIEYPKLSQDIVSLLSGPGGSALSQRAIAQNELLETFPLGDTNQSFSYLRFPVDAVLMEQDMASSDRVVFPCLLSVMRSQRQPNLEFVIASQNGVVQLRLQDSKSIGPVWDDVRWNSDTSTIEIRLPRGFLLSVECLPADFRMLWNIFEFNGKVQGTLFPRKDEQVHFRSTLKSFQYFDSDPQSRSFPKDPIAGCDLALFERVLSQGAAAGPRNFHRGYRISVVTGPRTRSLSGVNHAYLPQYPVLFGFLRDENGDPALHIKFDNGRQKGSMVLTFNDEKERLRLHSLLIGTALQHDEHIVAEIPIEGLVVAQHLHDAEGLACLKKLPWQQVRVINDEYGGDSAPTVLSDKLRIIAEFKNGTIVDRVNVAPGELKLRLDPQDMRTLRVLRQAQQDMTVAISEAQAPRGLSHELRDALRILQDAATIRTFKFPSLSDLHNFQQVLTGHTVLFDGLASTFAISRRRMVVPIHKKWEAGLTRIQLAQEDKSIQLVAFFADFSHGDSMSFLLKGTDTFESINRAGKAGIKLVDAKFPLPPTDASDGRSLDEMAFVCLDMPELPGEHDDISILFESDEGKFSLWYLQPSDAFCSTNTPSQSATVLSSTCPRPCVGRIGCREFGRRRGSLLGATPENGGNGRWTGSRGTQWKQAAAMSARCILRLHWAGALEWLAFGGCGSAFRHQIPP